jgi:hypothetical protein
MNLFRLKNPRIPFLACPAYRRGILKRGRGIKKVNR